MAHFTTNTYTLKRKILTFTNKISRNLSKPERKFTADINDLRFINSTIYIH